MKIPGSIRGASLGEAFVALADDSTAVDWNPAGLAQIGLTEVQLTYVKYLADTSLSTANLATPLKKLGFNGSLGVGFLHFGIPAFNSTTDPNAVQPTASDLALSLAYGHWIHPRVALGLGGQLVSSRLDSETLTAGGLSSGLLVRLVKDRLQFGLAYNNLTLSKVGFGQTEGVESLPRNFRLGLMGRQRLGRTIEGLLSLEYSKSRDPAYWYKAGVEIIYREMIFLRIGRRLRVTQSPFSGQGHLDFGGLAGASLGLGIDHRGLVVNYAYIPMGILGPTHRFGLTLSPSRMRTREMFSSVEFGKKKVRFVPIPKILFEPGSIMLGPESRRRLSRIPDIMKMLPGIRIQIQGHTDLRENAEDNWRLSQDRAEAVRQYLVYHEGLNPDRMTVRGYGASRPRAINNTARGRALNRRVKIRILNVENE